MLTLFYYIMLKTLHKTACKKGHESNNSAIYDYLCTTIGCLKQFSGMCSQIHPQVLFAYVHACMEIKAGQKMLHMF